MEIKIAITPTATLTPDHFVQMDAKAAALGIKTDQFIVEAILAKLRENQPKRRKPLKPVRKAAATAATTAGRKNRRAAA